MSTEGESDSTTFLCGIRLAMVMIRLANEKQTVKSNMQMQKAIAECHVQVDGFTKVPSLTR